MSTRAVYTFKDGNDTFAVYKHYDGYPEGAADFLDKARGYAWRGDRFEAADFAAAFVAANKKEDGGDVYFTKGYSRHGDLDYDYVVSLKKIKGTVYKWVSAYEYNFVEGAIKRHRFYDGTLVDFISKHKKKQAA